MPQRKLVFVGFVLAALGQVSVFAGSIQNKHDGGFDRNSMTYLGSMDGKSYFYETYPQRNWSEAKRVCRDSNMHLASITSNNQANFLNGNYNMPNYTSNWFWTAGRELLTISQFYWDSDHLVASAHGMDFVGVGPSFQTCLAFKPAGTANGLLQRDLCSLPMGTICEIHHTRKA